MNLEVCFVSPTHFELYHKGEPVEWVLSLYPGSKAVGT
jgi:hypothetical protein